MSRSFIGRRILSDLKGRRNVMKIGIVDVDTSHPDKWIPIERELGHEVVGIWDGGAVHPP